MKNKIGEGDLAINITEQINRKGAKRLYRKRLAKLKRNNKPVYERRKKQPLNIEYKKCKVSVWNRVKEFFRLIWPF